MQHHVATFHKCASNWTRRLFRDLADQRGMSIWVDEPNDASINQRVDRRSDDVLCIYRNGVFRHFKERANGPAPVVLCIRDPKDVLVSQYYSWKATHQNNTQRINDIRAKLANISVHDGLMLLIDEDLVSFCSCVREWPSAAEDANIHLLRYENLLEDFEPAFCAAASHLGLKLDDSYVADLEEKYSFRSIAKRDPGKEDKGSHYRKGVQGDWANHFDSVLAAAFDARYGDVCDSLGYSRAQHGLRSDQ
jgi:sulfotransferase family protein